MAVLACCCCVQAHCIEQEGHCHEKLQSALMRSERRQGTVIAAGDVAYDSAAVWNAMVLDDIPPPSSNAPRPGMWFTRWNFAKNTRFHLAVRGWG
jgi:hypothetical protein